MMSIKDLIAKVTGLEQRATEAFKAELTELKNLVNSTIADLQAQLGTANTTVTQLRAEVADFTGKLSTANQQTKTVSDSLKAAFTALNLEYKAEMPVVDQIKAIQTAVSGTMAKLNVPAGQLPGTKPTDNAQQQAGGGKTMTMKEFRALSPGAQSQFCAQVRAGQAKLVD